MCRALAFSSSDRRTAPGHVLDVVVERLLGLGLLLEGAVGHALAAGDDVDQQAEERSEDQHDDPARLGPAAERLVAEEIDDHAEQHHQHADEDEVTKISQMASQIENAEHVESPLILNW